MPYIASSESCLKDGDTSISDNIFTSKKQHLPGIPMKGAGYRRLSPWIQSIAIIVQTVPDTKSMVSVIVV